MVCAAANPFPDFTGFDSNIILISRGEIPRPIGNVQGSLSQAILAGIILVTFRTGQVRARFEKKTEPSSFGNPLCPAKATTTTTTTNNNNNNNHNNNNNDNNDHTTDNDNIIIIIIMIIILIIIIVMTMIMIIMILMI